VPVNNPETEPVNQEIRGQPSHRNHAQDPLICKEAEEGNKQFGQPDEEEELPEGHPYERVRGVKEAGGPNGAQDLAQTSRGKNTTGTEQEKRVF
jgi:hypothetical protein